MFRANSSSISRTTFSPLIRGGGGGKALTMAMTPWNLTHGQWSKKLTMATDSLEPASWSMVKMATLWSNFVVKSKVYHFDHRNLGNSFFGHGHGQNEYFCG